MKHVFLDGFVKKLENFSPEIQSRFYKQLNFLVKNIRHPSLRSKKYDETQNIWQARVDKNIRFYFLIKKDVYVLLDIRYHTD